MKIKLAAATTAMLLVGAFATTALAWTEDELQTCYNKCPTIENKTCSCVGPNNTKMPYDEEVECCRQVTLQCMQGCDVNPLPPNQDQNKE